MTRLALFAATLMLVFAVLGAASAGSVLRAIPYIVAAFVAGAAVRSMRRKLRQPLE